MLDTAIQKYFWDVNPASVDPILHKRYVIERILDLGDEQAVAWLRRAYAKADILAVIEDSKRLSPKSRNFWRLATKSL